jgi:hypothetical protein
MRHSNDGASKWLALIFPKWFQWTSLDKGLNGDLGRLPLLTWSIFLKFHDDLEIQREQEAKLAGKKFNPANRSLTDFCGHWASSIAPTWPTRHPGISFP